MKDIDILSILNRFSAKSFAIARYNRDDGVLTVNRNRGVTLDCQNGLHFFSSHSHLEYFVDERSLAILSSWLDGKIYPDSVMLVIPFMSLSRQAGNNFAASLYRCDNSEELLIVANGSPFIGDERALIRLSDNSSVMFKEKNEIHVSHPLLSVGERQSLRACATGLSIRQEAVMACCSESKIKQNRSAIMKKLMSKNMHEAILRADVFFNEKLFEP